jgi:hypothetical protein
LWGLECSSPEPRISRKIDHPSVSSWRYAAWAMCTSNGRKGASHFDYLRVFRPNVVACVHRGHSLQASRSTLLCPPAGSLARQPASPLVGFLPAAHPLRLQFHWPPILGFHLRFHPSATHVQHYVLNALCSTLYSPLLNSPPPTSTFSIKSLQCIGVLQPPPYSPLHATEGLGEVCHTDAVAFQYCDRHPATPHPPTQKISHPDCNCNLSRTHSHQEGKDPCTRHHSLWSK